MGSWLPRPAYPLLVKELAQLASRRRTYWFRAACALVAFFVFASLYGQQSGALGLLGWGGGRWVYGALLTLQYVLLFALLPGMMSSVVSEERERGTFELLVTTPLSPWEILLAKYAGRLVPLLGLLALSLPLLAMAYSLGGVMEGELVWGAYLLVLTVLQVGAIGLFASAGAASSVSAFLRAYALTAALYLGLPMFLFWLTWAAGGAGAASAVWSLIPYASLPWASGPLAALAAGTPLVLATLVFLAAARLVFPRPAAGEGRESLLRWASQAVSRAMRAKGTGIRLAVMVFVPLVILGAAGLAEMPSRAAGALIGLLVFFLWAVALVVLAAKGASAFAIERARRTLDVLLVTPLSGAEIVGRVALGLRPTLVWLAVPFLALFLLKAAFAGSLAYLLGSLLCLAIYLPLIAWFSIAAGLLVQGRGRAVTAAIGGLLAWIVLPLIAVTPRLRGLGPDPWLLASPVSLPFLLEVEEGAVGALAGLNALLYGACWFGIRQWTLARADRWLGRA